MNNETKYLRNLLSRLISEVRPYCRPSMVNYDVFPVFKEAVDCLEVDMEPNKVLTLTIQIGNSDDKLSQADWASFCRDTLISIEESCYRIHFSGGSSFGSPWQNACYVVEVINDKQLEILKDRLKVIARRFKQDAIAVTVGNTIFLNPKEPLD